MPFPSDKTNQSRQRTLEPSRPAYKTHNGVKLFLKHPCFYYAHFYTSTKFGFDSATLERNFPQCEIATTLISNLDAGEFWRDNSIDASNDFLKCYNE